MRIRFQRTHLAHASMRLAMCIGSCVWTTGCAAELGEGNDEQRVAQIGAPARGSQRLPAGYNPDRASLENMVRRAHDYFATHVPDFTQALNGSDFNLASVSEAALRMADTMFPSPHYRGANAVLFPSVVHGNGPGIPLEITGSTTHHIFQRHTRFGRVRTELRVAAETVPEVGADDVFSRPRLEQMIDVLFDELGSEASMLPGAFRLRDPHGTIVAEAPLIAPGAPDAHPFADYYLNEQQLAAALGWLTDTRELRVEMAPLPFGGIQPARIPHTASEAVRNVQQRIERALKGGDPKRQRFAIDVYHPRLDAGWDELNDRRLSRLRMIVQPNPATRGVSLVTVFGVDDARDPRVRRMRKRTFEFIEKWRAVRGDEAATLGVLSQIIGSESRAREQLEQVLFMCDLVSTMVRDGRLPLIEPGLNLLENSIRSAGGDA